MLDFTISVEQSMLSTVNQILDEESRSMTGQELREYLNDPATLATPGFLLRRYLYQNSPDLIEACRGQHSMKELQETLFTGWPEDVVARVADKKANPAEINVLVWKNCLSSKRCPQRKTILNIALALQMKETDLTKILMVSNLPISILCFRDPVDIIYWYSLKKRYTVEHAKKLIECYQEQCKNTHSPETPISGAGYSIVLRENVKQVFESALDEYHADQELLGMLEEETKKGNFNAQNMTAREDLLRMLEYATNLYDCPEVGDLPPIERSASEKISLKSLINAIMCSQDGWNITVQNDDVFGKTVVNFCNQWYQHIGSVIAGSSSVERRDVLLLTYFIIIRFECLSRKREALKNYFSRYHSIDERETNSYGQDHRLYKKLSSLFDSLSTLSAVPVESETVDGYMSRLFTALDKIYLMRQDSTYEPEDYFKEYRNLFDSVLFCFGFHETYLPNPFDRFLLMSIYSDTPQNFTFAVLLNIEQEDYDQDEILQQALRLSEPPLPPVSRNLSYEERLSLVKEFIAHGGGHYAKFAREHNVDYQQLYTWVKNYKADPENGLKKNRGRPRKDSEHNKT